MATGRDYLHFILDQLSELDGITYRAMMGEYILYYDGKIAAYLCDDRLLVKPVAAVLEIMPNARRELPYEGVKEMLLVENVDDRAFLQSLFRAMYPQLPAPKKRNARTG